MQKLKEKGKKSKYITVSFAPFPFYAEVTKHICLYKPWHTFAQRLHIKGNFESLQNDTSGSFHCEIAYVSIYL
jgi:hypothetical protein